MPGCILKNVTDKPIVRSIAEFLIQEQANKYPNQNEVITQFINTIITLAARNITLMDSYPDKKNSSADALFLLNYIHQNIYSPEKLKSEQLAEHFNISPTYITEYFKKHIGQSLQQYITEYKLKLIETRLRYTNVRLNEIAYEFGFTDQSHLNRIFKKYKGTSPSVYRQLVRDSSTDSVR